MRILVLEYVTGGGMVADKLPESLIHEGRIMLNALINELSQIPEIEIISFCDYRLSVAEQADDHRFVEWMVVKNRHSFWKLWNIYVNSCDAIWPIAPETGGVLEKLCVDVEKAGKTLLSSSSDAVHQTASKFTTWELLKRNHIPVIPTYKLVSFQNEVAAPWVIKPDDGVGCEGVRIVSDTKELNDLSSELDPNSTLIQPYVLGDSISLSILFNNGTGFLLGVNRQLIIEENRRIRLIGCEVNAVGPNSECEDLTKQIADAIPGLWGYVGVDLIDTGSETYVVEINPRLTTSYAGLGEALGENIADLVLSATEPSGTPRFEHRSTRSVLVPLGLG